MATKWLPPLATWPRLSGKSYEHPSTYLCRLSPLTLSSGSNVLSTLSREFRIVLQKISRRVVGNDLFNISPSNIFPTKVLPKRFYLICLAVLADVLCILNTVWKVRDVTHRLHRLHTVTNWIKCPYILKNMILWMFAWKNWMVQFKR